MRRSAKCVAIGITKRRVTSCFNKIHFAQRIVGLRVQLTSFNQQHFQVVASRSQRKRDSDRTGADDAQIVGAVIAEFVGLQYQSLFPFLKLQARFSCHSFLQRRRRKRLRSDPARSAINVTSVIALKITPICFSNSRADSRNGKNHNVLHRYSGELVSMSVEESLLRCWKNPSQHLLTMPCDESSSPRSAYLRTLV